MNDRERTQPPMEAGELDTLLGFLDFHRDTLEWKCDGLTPVQLAQRATPPSALSLLGLVRHLAEVEYGWFTRVADLPRREPRFFTAEQPDLDFDGAVGEQAAVDEAWTYWREAVAFAREVSRSTPLESTFTHSRTGEVISHRWVLVHMIEEYARHNGHADLLREAIDGATGE